MKALALDDFFDRRCTILRAQIEVEFFLPQRREINKVPLLAEILLRDLQFHGFVCFVQAGEERRDWLLRLKVDGAIFDLHDHVGRELAVERMKDVVGGARAVGLHVVVVEMIVVDKGAIEHYSAVRRESMRQHVGSVGWAAAIAGGAGLAFRIGFDRDAREIGNLLVDLVDLCGPPGFHIGIERIEGLEAADFLRAGDIDADGEPHAPWPHGVGDARQAFDHVRRQEKEPRRSRYLRCSR